MSRSPDCIEVYPARLTGYKDKVGGLRGGISLRACGGRRVDDDEVEALRFGCPDGIGKSSLGQKFNVWRIELAVVAPGNGALLGIKIEQTDLKALARGYGQVYGYDCFPEAAFLSDDGYLLHNCNPSGVRT
jgi:hypothetical protein